MAAALVRVGQFRLARGPGNGSAGVVLRDPCCSECTIRLGSRGRKGHELRATRPCGQDRRSRYAPGVDGGVNPRKSGDDRKAGTRFAACDQPLLAIYRSDANGCPVALCQRRQPPKAGAVGQCLQRVAGQSSWTIKNDGWFRIAKVRLTRERPYAKTVRFSERPHRRLRADSRRRQHHPPRPAISRDDDDAADAL